MAKPRTVTVKAEHVLDLTLNEARRAQVQAQLDALKPAEVERPRSYLAERIEWMATLLASAWRDRARLVGIEIDGSPLREDELRLFGWQIARLREAVDQWQRAQDSTPAAGSGEAQRAVGEMSAQALREEQREIHRKLLAAFDLRFRKSAEGRRKLKQIRRGSGDGDIASDNTALLALCTSEAHREWLAALPKGEAAAVARLAALDEEFNARRARPEVTSRERIDLGAQRDRCWTLAARTADRVRCTGKYMFSDDPARKGDYAAFKPPRTRKRV